MSPESQALQARITEYWDTLPPPQLRCWGGLEGAHLSERLRGKNWREADFERDLFAESVFVFLHPKARVYFLGPAMIHALSSLERGESLGLCFPTIGLVSALTLIGGSSVELAEEILLQPGCFEIVRDFVAYLFAQPEVQEDYSTEYTYIPDTWKTLETLRERVAIGKAKYFAE